MKMIKMFKDIIYTLKTKRRHLVRRIFRPFGLDFSVTQISPMISHLNRSGKQDLVGVEIGVQAGWNALDILRNLPIKKLYLIDPYLDYPDYHEYGNSKENQKILDWCKKNCKRILRKYKDKIMFINLFSEEAAKIFKDGELDFVYIDGNHSYKYVKKDIKLYYPKVKIGGVIGGDDYSNYPTSEIMNFGVVRAVNEFFKGKKFYFMQTDWWYEKKH